MFAAPLYHSAVQPSFSITLIGDLGTVRDAGDGLKQEEIDTYSLRWLAPEMISSGIFDRKGDVYCISNIIWELLTAEVPFGNMNGIQAALSIADHGLRPHIPDTCPPEVARLITACWNPSASERPDPDDIIHVLGGLTMYFPECSITTTTAGTTTPTATMTRQCSPSSQPLSPLSHNNWLLSPSSSTGLISDVSRPALKQDAGTTGSSSEPVPPYPNTVITHLANTSLPCTTAATSTSSPSAANALLANTPGTNTSPTNTPALANYPPATAAVISSFLCSSTEISRSSFFPTQSSSKRSTISQLELLRSKAGEGGYVVTDADEDDDDILDKLWSQFFALDNTSSNDHGINGRPNNNSDPYATSRSTELGNKDSRRDCHHHLHHHSRSSGGHSHSHGGRDLAKEHCGSSCPTRSVVCILVVKVRRIFAKLRETRRSEKKGGTLPSTTANLSAMSAMGDNSETSSISANVLAMKQQDQISADNLMVEFRVVRQAIHRMSFPATATSSGDSTTVTITDTKTTVSESCGIETPAACRIPSAQPEASSSTQHHHHHHIQHHKQQQDVILDECHGQKNDRHSQLHQLQLHHNQHCHQQHANHHHHYQQQKQQQQVEEQEQRDGSHGSKKNLGREVESSSVKKIRNNSSAAVSIGGERVATVSEREREKPSLTGNAVAQGRKDLEGSKAALEETEFGLVRGWKEREMQRERQWQGEREREREEAVSKTGSLGTPMGDWESDVTEGLCNGRNGTGLVGLSWVSTPTLDHTLYPPSDGGLQTQGSSSMAADGVVVLAKGPETHSDLSLSRAGWRLPLRAKTGHDNDSRTTTAPTIEDDGRLAAFFAIAAAMQRPRSRLLSCFYPTAKHGQTWGSNLGSELPAQALPTSKGSDEG
ncbi:hypothetical protein CBR_g34455 [Chara braunii]|uniref:Protein kinase domain-containing protein n=1 Tax=Chara braunii TaxID=69332 RepID=A0A388LIV9_CHABU|nr:hypothetical protein CBR_g34455 [Chara braunii]|eukprot:GBG82173.1 hypothetical protein CBR_g34455 [Chara braunii]